MYGLSQDLQHSLARLRGDPVIPIARPLLGDEEKEAVIAVLNSGRLVQGPRVEDFEGRFAAFCGARYAIATSSGTAALYIALLAHGISPGDEVITTPFSFIASANSIVSARARPVFVDIEEDSFNIDPRLIEEKITPRTKAIIPVHLYGNPCDMEAILEIAARHGLVVIEDACQAHGASIDGRKVGSFGTGCFSFYASKNMVTGEGGMITTDDKGVAERARLIRQHGMRRQYYHDMWGFNFRMTEFQAAIGIVQLEKLEDFNRRRIENAAYLTENLRRVITPQVRDGFRHVFHQYTIRVLDGRDKMLEGLRRRDIDARVYYPLPIHKQAFYQQLGYHEELPLAEKASQEVLSLPVHPGLTPAELERIVEEVNGLAC